MPKEKETNEGDGKEMVQQKTPFGPPVCPWQLGAQCGLIYYIYYIEKAQVSKRCI